MTSNSDLRKILKYITFMKITEKIGNLSYDMKHQVGSIVVAKDFSNVCGVGYNGNYPGGVNERDSMETGQSGFLHAEENALSSNMIHGEDYIMFVTMTPCKMCAKRIARRNKNIKEVIALNNYGTTNVSYDILSNANIEFNYLSNKLLILYSNTDLFAELSDIISNTDEESMSNVLMNLLFKQLNDFFEFNKEPLVNIPLLEMKIESTDKYNIIQEYFKVFQQTLYAVL